MGKVFLWTILLTHSGVLMANEHQPSIANFFNAANYENMDQVCRQFYDDKIHFEDPLGSIHGIDKLIAYYKNLYENVTEIQFKPVSEWSKENESVFVWQMHVKHKKLGGGEPIIVDGVSLVKYQNGRAIYHRDYFDLGAMLYEKIPLLGSVIRWIKSIAHGQ